MSARWDDPQADQWHEGGVVRGVALALVIEAVAVFVALVILAALFSGWTSEKPGKLGPAWHETQAPSAQPALYSECVLNRHVSDICLGA